MKKLPRSLHSAQVWHVMSRGVRQSPIFLTDRQRLDFMDMMEWAIQSTAADVISFCLMDNHFHMLARATGERLGKFMQLLNSRYAREFNEQTESSGHLFQGRYRAYPAKNGAWIASRALYIHLNPVEAGLVTDPLDYRWSSLRGFLGKGCELPLLNPSPVLEMYGQNTEEQRRNYLNHIRSATRQCLANRAITDTFLRNDGSDMYPEDVRLQVSEARRVIAKTQETLLPNGSSTPEQARTAQMLATYLCRDWDLATPKILAVVLGCSVRSVQYYLKSGQKLLQERADMQDIANFIREQYANPLSQDPLAP